MKFIRRSDLEPQTRIDIVRLAWQGQGIYGKLTQLAREYHIFDLVVRKLKILDEASFGEALFVSADVIRK